MSAPVSTTVPTLTVHTEPVADPGPLLHLLPRDGALAWVRGGAGLVGRGTALRRSFTGAGALAAADAWWREVAAAAAVRDAVGRPGSGLVAFGSFAFDPRRGPGLLVVPQVLYGHRDGCWWRTTVQVADAAAPADPAADGPPAPPVGLRLRPDPAADARWQEAVAEVVRRIAAGSVDKVVLARELVAGAAEPVDLRWPLRRLGADYPECWAFAVEGLLGATPELLVRLDRGRVTSRVLAGTLGRTGDANEDSRRGAALPRSIKDVEEHGYGVQSVVRALARLGAVEEPGEPFVLALRNVMHLATDVRATVDGVGVLGLLAALHPSAAVCGSPTDRALALIGEVEGLDRGRYAGPVGWLDGGGDGEFGIALRCAQVDPGDPARLRLYAGCGIVAGSVPARELAESNAKLVPMREALGAPAR